jgi:hypothetical protein
MDPEASFLITQQLSVPPLGLDVSALRARARIRLRYGAEARS